MKFKEKMNRTTNESIELKNLAIINNHMTSKISGMSFAIKPKILKRQKSTPDKSPDEKLVNPKDSMIIHQFGLTSSPSDLQITSGLDEKLMDRLTNFINIEFIKDGNKNPTQGSLIPSSSHNPVLSSSDSSSQILYRKLSSRSKIDVNHVSTNETESAFYAENINYAMALKFVTNFQNIKDTAKSIYLKLTSSCVKAIFLGMIIAYVPHFFYMVHNTDSPLYFVNIALTKLTDCTIYAGNILIAINMTDVSFFQYKICLGWNATEKVQSF